MLRKIIYANNAIESLNSRVRKAVRSHGHFPSDEAAGKLIYLVLHECRSKMDPTANRLARNRGAICDRLRRAFRALGYVTPMDYEETLNKVCGIA